MKFMKLGSRPDTFVTTEAARSVSSDVSSDIVIQVAEIKYLLHKFPLLSKSAKLQQLSSDLPESSPQIIILPDFPSGVEAFELCAKFCYGITITIGAHNIVASRCAAEYLQMTEAVEKGNLIYKLEMFMNSCILQGWRDSLLAIKSTKEHPQMSEDLGITTRCVDGIAFRVTRNPSKINLSRTNSRRGNNVVSCKGWWAEDLSELSMDLYWRIMIAVKAAGEVSPLLVGEALKIYAARWLPNITRREDDSSSKNRVILESIVSLLPAEKNAVSGSFLLKLLKAANIVKASSSSKAALVGRVGLQLEEATVGDLLIPSYSSEETTFYDVDLFLCILEQFSHQGQSPPTSPLRLTTTTCERRRSRSAENIDYALQDNRRSSSASHSSKLRVAKLVDGYLQAVANDPRLSLTKFTAISEAVPKFSRLVHDDLYKAIDIYLKTHPELNKSERKQLCSILDCKKLSVEVCVHAAQNELLPLRVVVQVLFYEQARAATSEGKVTEFPGTFRALLSARPISAISSSGEDQWSIKCSKSAISTLRVKLEEDETDDADVRSEGIEKSGKVKPFCALPRKHISFFSKLWPINSKVAT